MLTQPVKFTLTEILQGERIVVEKAVVAEDQEDMPRRLIAGDLHFPRSILPMVAKLTSHIFNTRIQWRKILSA